MSKSYREERDESGKLTGCAVTTEHSDGCTTVERRDASEDWLGVTHGAVTDKVTYGPSHKA